MVHATALYVDSFGNIALNLTRDDLVQIGIVPGTRVELDLWASATTPWRPARSPMPAPAT